MERQLRKLQQGKFITINSPTLLNDISNDEDLIPTGCCIVIASDGTNVHRVFASLVEAVGAVGRSILGNNLKQLPMLHEIFSEPISSVQVNTLSLQKGISSRLVFHYHGSVLVFVEKLPLTFRLLHYELVGQLRSLYSLTQERIELQKSCQENYYHAGTYQFPQLTLEMEKDRTIFRDINF